MILLPLGPRGGVGQLPTPDGPAVVSAATVAEYKGSDIYTGRFTEQFGTPDEGTLSANGRRDEKTRN